MSDDEAGEDGRGGIPGDVDSLPPDCEAGQLDSEEAFRVGLLAELSAIRVELGAIRETLAADTHPTARDGGTDPDADDDPPIACRCGAAFDTLDEAADHARREHKAPNADAVEALLQEDSA